MIVNWKAIESIASVITAASFIVGFIITVINIRTANKLRRTDLLNSLFEKFFYNDTYKDVRGIIDYSLKIPESRKRLENSLEKKTDTKTEEKFVDFFNFFEYIAVLHKLGQLEIIEIKYMFEYYFKMLGKEKIILKYLSENGF